MIVGLLIFLGIIAYLIVWAIVYGLMDRKCYLTYGKRMRRIPYNWEIKFMGINLTRSGVEMLALCWGVVPIYLLFVWGVGIWHWLTGKIVNYGMAEEALQEGENKKGIYR